VRGLDRGTGRFVTRLRQRQGFFDSTSLKQVVVLTVLKCKMMIHFAVYKKLTPFGTLPMRSVRHSVTNKRTPSRIKNPSRSSPPCRTSTLLHCPPRSLQGLAPSPDERESERVRVAQSVNQSIMAAQMAKRTRPFFSACAPYACSRSSTRQEDQQQPQQRPLRTAGQPECPPRLRTLDDTNLRCSLLSHEGRQERRHHQLIRRFRLWVLNRPGAGAVRTGGGASKQSDSYDDDNHGSIGEERQAPTPSRIQDIRSKQGCC
jgi:hypothetical protein